MGAQQQNAIADGIAALAEDMRPLAQRHFRSASGVRPLAQHVRRDPYRRLLDVIRHLTNSYAAGIGQYGPLPSGA